MSLKSRAGCYQIDSVYLALFFHRPRRRTWLDRLKGWFR